MMGSMPAQAWIFPARVERVVDGDTLDVRLDTGFHTEHVERLRLLGVDAPEMHGESKAAGEAAREYVVRWLAAAKRAGYQGWPLYVSTHKTDDFGRYLANVWRRGDGRRLNDDLLNDGQAVAYAG